MKVQDVMTERVITCAPDTNLATAVGMMWDHDCGALPVLDNTGKVIGMITDRDIAIALGTRNRLAGDIPVRDVMSHEVFFCTPDDDIHGALRVMRREKVRRLPVVNANGVIEGIVSMNDVALHAEKVDAQKPGLVSYEDTVNTMKAICEHRHPRATKQVIGAIAH